MADLFNTLVIADSDADNRLVTIEEVMQGKHEEWNGTLLKLGLFGKDIARGDGHAATVPDREWGFCQVEDGQRRITATIALYNITSVIINDIDGEEIASWQRDEH